MNRGRFSGVFNKTYKTWEFRTSENQADVLYGKMIRFIEDALVTPSPEPSTATQYQRAPTTNQVKKLPISDEVALPTFQSDAEEEAFRERAAILEYENNLSRADAEKIAIKEIFLSKIK